MQNSQEVEKLESTKGSLRCQYENCPNDAKWSVKLGRMFGRYCGFHRDLAIGVEIENEGYAVVTTMENEGDTAQCLNDGIPMRIKVD